MSLLYVQVKHVAYRRGRVLGRRGENSGVGVNGW